MGCRGNRVGIGINVTAIFLMQDMWRNFLPKFIEIYMEIPYCAHLDGQEYGSQKPTETSVTEFCSKSMNLSLEELKTLK